MGSRWLLIACLMLLLQISFEATSEQSSSSKNVKRQTKRRNNVGFFGLVRNFVRDTIADTNFAIRNITEIVNMQFPPAGAQQDDDFAQFCEWAGRSEQRGNHPALIGLKEMKVT